MTLPFISTHSQYEPWVSNKRLETLKFLVDVCKADFSGIDSTNGLTPLGFAASQGFHESVKFLLGQEGIDRHLGDKHGNTPLALAEQALRQANKDRKTEKISALKETIRLLS